MILGCSKSEVHGRCQLNSLYFLKLRNRPRYQSKTKPTAYQDRLWCSPSGLLQRLHHQHRSKTSQMKTLSAAKIKDKMSAKPQRLAGAIGSEVDTDWVTPRKPKIDRSVAGSGRHLRGKSGPVAACWARRWPAGPAPSFGFREWDGEEAGKRRTEWNGPSHAPL